MNIYLEMQIHGGDIYSNKVILDFSSNINPLGMPEGVIKAAKESIENAGVYPDINCAELTRVLSEYEGIPEGCITTGNGAAELIFAFARALSPKRALLPVPSFSEYENALRAASCEIKKYYMPEFKIEEGILKLLNDDIDAVFLCSPNNPTGFLIDQNLLEDIADVCLKKGIFLFLDECFLDFAKDGRALSMKKHVLQNNRLFILDSFTKKYAMAGLRLGYGLCSDTELNEKIKKQLPPWNVSAPAQAAGLAALNEEEYLKKSYILVNEQREYMKAEIKNLGLTVYDSKANFIFFKGPSDLYERCLEREILIRDCAGYDGLGEGYFRAAVKMPDENEKLLDTLKEIKKWQNR